MALLENINRKIIEYQSTNNITQNNLDLIVDSLNNLILESADNSFSKCTTNKFCAPNANPPSLFGKKCSKLGRDEFHYMLVCDKLKEQRLNFLKACFYKRPNTLKYDSLMTSKNTKILTSVSKFIKTTYEICKQC